MKITLLLVVFATALSINPLLGAAASAPEPVLDTSGKKVRTSVNYYIVPASYPYAGGGAGCPDSTVWMLKDYDSSASQKFVTLGGALGNPGKLTLADWFKIEKYEDAYKLYYCPNVYYDGSYPCSDIGISEDEYGNKRLALSDVPYKVRFQLA
ncbi:hypothetical protein PIB30_099834 [Stylosanthes scabra]|uniref:Uncharacterized protein n=1 Tax=Stylosanthes scabra TaxID=79078 RepID=A0ABU6UYX0_9FABA|nr:hypothetical protein [Stylosanthes scabra]